MLSQTMTSALPYSTDELVWFGSCAEFGASITLVDVNADHVSHRDFSTELLCLIFGNSTPAVGS